MLITSITAKVPMKVLRKISSNQYLALFFFGFCFEYQKIEHSTSKFTTTYIRIFQLYLQLFGVFKINSKDHRNVLALFLFSEF